PRRLTLRTPPPVSPGPQDGRLLGVAVDWIRVARRPAEGEALFDLAGMDVGPGWGPPGSDGAGRSFRRMRGAESVLDVEVPAGEVSVEIVGHHRPRRLEMEVGGVPVPLGEDLRGVTRG